MNDRRGNETDAETLSTPDQDAALLFGSWIETHEAHLRGVGMLYRFDRITRVDKAYLTSPVTQPESGHYDPNYACRVSIATVEYYPSGTMPEKTGVAEDGTEFTRDCIQALTDDEVTERLERFRMIVAELTGAGV